MITHPFGHNYNRALIIFSLDIWQNKEVLKFLVASYSGFYTLILSFLAVQFIYRLLTLVNVSLARKFEGVGVLGWISYPVFCGGLYILLYYLFAEPDEYSVHYLKYEMLRVYDMDIENISHFSLIPYESDNTLRWNNLLFILLGGCLLGIQYFIIIFCGFQMHFSINSELGHLSMPNKKLQKQFFQALIAQTLVPTFLFVFPAIPLLAGPVLDKEWSMETGIIVSLLSIYPPIDSLVFMVIVTEYKRIIRGEEMRRVE
ncbi:unnamed protein product [Caenorhabditis brenneri]